MAESLAFWVCRCGTANHKSDRRCRICSNRKPWKLKSFIVIAVATGLAVTFHAASDKDKQQASVRDQRPHEQVEFTGKLASFDDKLRAAANQLSQVSITRQRNMSAGERRKVVRWIGTVLGINEINGKGAIRVDIYGAVLVAGISSSSAIDTLISPSNTQLFETIKGLRSGDLVSNTCTLVADQNGLVEAESAFGFHGPDYLCEFSEIRMLK